MYIYIYIYLFCLLLLDESACIFVELKERKKDADCNNIRGTITKKYREMLSVDDCYADITGVIPPVFVVNRAS